MERVQPAPETKRVYTAPRLTVHGPVEEITLRKFFGSNDSFTFDQQPIGS